jgi:hypothetical protein
VCACAERGGWGVECMWAFVVWTVRLGFVERIVDIVDRQEEVVGGWEGVCVLCAVIGSTAYPPPHVPRLAPTATPLCVAVVDIPRKTITV